MAAPRAADEAGRLRALHAFHILHKSDELNFVRIINLIKDVFGVKMAVLTLMDANEHWTKACSGYNVPHTDRSTGMAAHVVVLRGDEPLVVLDTRKDWRFANNPHVQSTPGVRFYAGAPVRSPDGYVLGSLSIADDEARDAFPPKSQYMLKEFAAIVTRELELWSDRLRMRTRARMQTALEEFTRQCLETTNDDMDADGGDHLLTRVYERAAGVIGGALDLGGCSILDISQFQSIGLRNPDDGSVNTIYHTNQYPIGEVAPVPVTAFPILASTLPGVEHRALLPEEHAQVSQFLWQHREGQIYGVPPRWIRSVLPRTANYTMLVPVMGIDNQPVALIVAHTRDLTGQTLDAMELQFLRNVGSVILSAVLRRKMVLGDRAKNILISSVSHELRTPLHGMLAASELLCDTPLDVNQEAFLATLRTCGMQLIETVNDVLDFAKLSVEGKGGTARAIQFRQTDLADLIHQAVEGCWLGHRPRLGETRDGSGSSSFFSPEPEPVGSDKQHPNGTAKHTTRTHVETVIDIGFRRKGWTVSCEIGGLRRCIMNLYNNSLKFTTTGYVQIALRELPHAEGVRRIPVELSVIDTGKGIGREFLKNNLFEPFAQENPLQQGTGLGLAIVADIVTSDALGGQVDVYSAEDVGTEIKVSFEVETVDADEHSDEDDQIGKGYAVALVNYCQEHRGLALQAEVIRSNTAALGFRFVDDARDADLLIANEVAEVESANKNQGNSNNPTTSSRSRPMILVVSAKIHDAASIAAMGRTAAYTGVLYKPMGMNELRRELAGAVAWMRNPGDRALIGVLAGKRRVEAGAAAGAAEGCPSLGTQEEYSNASMDPGAVLETPTRADSGPRDGGLDRDGDVDSPTTQTFHTTPTPTPRRPSIDSLMLTPPPTTHSATPPPAPFCAPVSPITEFSTVSMEGGIVLASVCPPASPPPPPLRRTRPPRILVVEDNPINRRVLAALLRKRGFAYEEAVNGRAGVEAFVAKPDNYWE
jgi:signal transduction histidine kinase